jgi:uncharacterized OsmC-like protein
MGEVVSRFDVHVEQVREFEFLVRFDKEQYAPLRMDEPPPLGHDAAPNPARILAAAIGNCLAASLVFCAKKSGAKLDDVRADVGVELVRNERRRLRIGKVSVRLETALPLDHPAIAGCLETFEDFCVVTQSVREGIDIAVEVVPRADLTPAAARPSP